MITLYVAENCKTCNTILNKLNDILPNFNTIGLKVVNIAKENPQKIKIVPALFVDEELYSYGEFNITRFLERLQKKHQNKLRTVN